MEARDDDNSKIDSPKNTTANRIFPPPSRASAQLAQVLVLLLDDGEDDELELY